MGVGARTLARTDARTHYHCQWGLLAERQKYFGPGAPMKITDGADSTPRRTALVSRLVRISYTRCNREACRGQKGGMTVMVALTPSSDWLSLSTQSSHGVLGRVWRKNHMRSSFRCQVSFLPILMGKRRKGSSIGNECLVGCNGWKRTRMPCGGSNRRGTFPR